MAWFTTPTAAYRVASSGRRNTWTEGIAMGIRKAFGSVGAGRVAVARAAGGGAARGPAAVLGVDCGGSVERGCGGWCRGFAGGRGALVSGGGRRAIINAYAMVEAADRAAPVVW